MTVTVIPFELNHKLGILNVGYEANQSAERSSFDLLPELALM